MPEAPDPYGSVAYQQRIFKEATAAAQARNVLRGNGYYLTNPITHNDRLVETLAPSVTGSSNNRPASVAPVSTASNRPVSSSSSQRHSARRGFEERVQQLEATLRDERKTREHVEQQLAKLEKILDAKQRGPVVE